MAETPWTRARKLRSTLQEERLNDMPGGRQQPNSGRFWRWKRDGVVWNFLVEARTTEHKSYRIEKDEFQLIRKQAFQTPPGLRPAMNLEIQDLRLIVIEESAFELMLARLIELEARLDESD